jgi:hypothetical protein
MREKSSIFGAVGIAATNLSRWLLRLKSQPRTLKSTNHSLQAWWLNENRLHRAITSRLQQGSVRFSVAHPAGRRPSAKLRAFAGAGPSKQLWPRPVLFGSPGHQSGCGDHEGDPGDADDNLMCADHVGLGPGLIDEDAVDGPRIAGRASAKNSANVPKVPPGGHRRPRWSTGTSRLAPQQ